MKSVNKTRVLAALALAFTLGVAVPVAGASAVAGDDAEVSTQSSDDEATNETAQASYVSSLADLYQRINDRTAFKEYREFRPIAGAIVVYDALSEKVENIQQAADQLGLKTTENYYEKLSDATKTAVGSKSIFDSLTQLKADALYTSNADFKSVVDSFETELAAAKTKLTGWLKANSSTEAATIDAMTPAQLMEAVAKAMGVDQIGSSSTDLEEFFDNIADLLKSNKYADFLVLYQIEEFLDQYTKTEGGKTVLDTAAMNAAEGGDKGWTLVYQMYGAVANIIDPTVLDGLASLSLPNTSVGTPDSGLVEMIENGSIDKGTVFIIIAGAVATIAGGSALAKLYLKRKF